MNKRWLKHHIKFVLFKLILSSIVFFVFLTLLIYDLNDGRVGSRLNTTSDDSPIIVYGFHILFRATISICVLVYILKCIKELFELFKDHKDSLRN